MAQKKPDIDKDLIRDLAALLKETELSEIEIEQDGFRVRISRQAAPAPTQVTYAEPKPAESSATSPPVEAPRSLADPARHPGCVPSPMVGTVYRASDPKAKPFVE